MFFATPLLLDVHVGGSAAINNYDLSILLPVFLSFLLYLSFTLSFSLSVSFCLCMSLSVSVCLSVRLSVCLSLFLSLSLSLTLSLSLVRLQRERITSRDRRSPPLNYHNSTIPPLLSPYPLSTPPPPFTRIRVLFSRSIHECRISFIDRLVPTLP